MTVHLNAISGRYAKALFELSLKEGCLDKVYEELSALTESSTHDQGIVKFFNNPVIPKECHYSFLKKIIERFKIQATLSNFLYVLAQNRRLSLLSTISTLFADMIHRHKNQLVAHVYCTVKLKSDQIKVLQTRLSSTLKKEVIIQPHIDTAILGGTIIRIGSLMLDDSVANKLRKFQLKTKEAFALN